MTWNAKITMQDGNIPTLEGQKYPSYLACQSCAHLTTCNLPKVVNILGSLLTSIDTGSDGHMAPGEAILKCRGYVVA